MKTLSKCVGGSRLKHHMLRLEHCLYATVNGVMYFADEICWRNLSSSQTPPLHFWVVGRTVNILLLYNFSISNKANKTEKNLDFTEKNNF